MKSAKAKARSVSKAMKKAKSVSKASSSKVAKKPKKTSRRPQSKKERLLQQKQRNALQQQRVAHTFSHAANRGITCRHGAWCFLITGCGLGLPAAVPIGTRTALLVAMITLRTPAALKAARDESWSPTGRGAPA
eukprot:Skav217676  [mRNA]  locus=scaffold2919:339946:341913:+ [translate_table: standard]